GRRCRLTAAHGHVLADSKALKGRLRRGAAELLGVALCFLHAGGSFTAGLVVACVTPCLVHHLLRFLRGAGLLELLDKRRVFLEPERCLRLRRWWARIVPGLLCDLLRSLKPRATPRHDAASLTRLAALARIAPLAEGVLRLIAAFSGACCGDGSQCGRVVD